MTNYVERCLIAPSAYVRMARALCAGISGDSGIGMLQAPLSANGKSPATHYISHGMIEEKFADLLPLLVFDEDGMPRSTSGQIETVTALARGAATLSQITQLMESIEVTNQSAFEALTRRALHLVA